MAVPAPTGRDAASSAVLRAAMWVAIAALVAAALICVVWVLLGGDDDIVAKAFLTVLLLAGFAGTAIIEARLAPRRPAWFVLTSMVTWVVVLLIGALFIWLPRGFDEAWSTGISRFLKFALIILILALALLHLRLYVREHLRYVTPFTRAVATATVGLVALLAALLVVPLVTEEWLDFPALYWRITVALAILAAVGTALLPLIRALFAPRDLGPAQPSRGWPTYADGRTPLPVMPGGAPDWNAYYTGYPTVAAPTWTGAGAAQPSPGAQPSQAAGAQPSAAATPVIPPLPGPVPTAPAVRSAGGASPAAPDAAAEFASAPAAPPPPAAGAAGAPAVTPPIPPLPPPPTTPFAAARSSSPVPASAHSWWGADTATPGATEQPAMRWAEDRDDWPTEPVRRQGRRRSGA